MAERDLSIILSDNFPWNNSVMALTGQSLDEIMKRIFGESGLEAHRMRPVNFFLNLYPSSHGLDVMLGKQRYLIYKTSPEEKASQDQLLSEGLPLFSPLATFGDEYFVSAIPADARCLSQMLLLDTKPADKTDIGSMEILHEAGKLLARIKNKTGQLPVGVDLSRLAFIPFQERDFIQLIPPFLLDNQESIEQIAELIHKNLSAQSGTVDILAQLNGFLSGYRESISPNARTTNS